MKIKSNSILKIGKVNIYTTISLIVLSLILTAFSALIYEPGLSLFKDHYMELLVISFLILCLLFTLYTYSFYQGKLVIKTNKRLLVTFSIIFVAVLTSIATMRYISVYTVPIAMSAVLVGIMVSKTLGFVTNAFTALITLSIYTAFEYLTFGTISGHIIIGILVALMQSYFMMYLIKKNYTRFKLLWGALAIGLIFAPVSMLISSLIYEEWFDILLVGAYSFCGNAIAVGLFTAILPLYESVFNVWTDFKLAEACSMSRPLLQRLSNEATGTFNHCIIVSNLCESCAIAIGENPYLAKACGIYHDVGKLSHPEYFVENQSDGYNPHDDLIPETSVKMITNHTLSGYKLLKDEHLPEEIARIAKEHHGTSLVRYFYKKSKDMTESAIDKSLFEYEGPKPTTKISAIVMIADVVEAATRAKTPNTSAELETLINCLIKSKIDENQFSDCPITFADLEKIKQTIMKVIPSIYHKRIDYEAKK